MTNYKYSFIIFRKYFLGEIKMTNKILKTLALFLAMAILFVVVPSRVSTIVAAGNNPYPSTQDVDGDGYTEIPCTRYAWQQAYDNLGVSLPSWGNAINWYNGAKNSGYTVGTTAQANSIAVWSIDTHSYGHVAFVTSVSGSNIIINEGGRTDKDNVNGGIVNGQQVPATVGSYWYGRTLIGFIYLSHTHSYGAWQTVTAPTCTTSGSSKRVCSCGDTQTRTDTALGHSWNNGEITQNAGCSDEGVKKYTCTRCSATKTEVISPTGHNPVTNPAVPATCTETGLTEGSYCANCNAIITSQSTVPELGHDYKLESYVIGCEMITATYKCERCSDIKNETVSDYILSDWSESKPENIDEGLIEEKIQYAFSDKSTTESTESELSDWICDDTKTTWSDYGAWSNWQNSAISSNDYRKVETNPVAAVTHQEYNYSRYINTSTGNCGPWAGTWSGVYCGTYQERGWNRTRITNIDNSQGFPIYYATSQNPWFNEQIKTVTDTAAYTQYRYCDRHKIYSFYKWSEYSDWSDEEYEESETRQVKNRTLYRYKIIPTNHNYTDIVTSPTCTEQGYTTHTCSICGDSYIDNYTDTLGHTESDWMTDTEAQIGINGSKHKECTVCHTILQTEEIPALENPAPPVDENAPQIVVSSGRAVLGNNINVTIALKNNPGIASAKLKVAYNSDVFTLTNVTDGGILGTSVHKPQMASPYTLSWVNDTATVNFTANGTLATLTFAVDENAQTGNYPITVSYSYDDYDIYNVDVEPIRFAVVNGNIEVTDVIIGDVNGDGKVNNLDRVVLTRYLADWDDYPESAVDMIAADVNCDGKVNNLDRVILTRYLADWDDYTELPYTG